MSLTSVAFIVNVILSIPLHSSGVLYSNSIGLLLWTEKKQQKQESKLPIIISNVKYKIFSFYRKILLTRFA